MFLFLYFRVMLAALTVLLSFLSSRTRYWSTFPCTCTRTCRRPRRWRRGLRKRWMWVPVGTKCPNCPGNKSDCRHSSSSFLFHTWLSLLHTYDFNRKKKGERPSCTSSTDPPHFTAPSSHYCRFRCCFCRVWPACRWPSSPPSWPSQRLARGCGTRRPSRGRRRRR